MEQFEKQQGFGFPKIPKFPAKKIILTLVILIVLASLTYNGYGYWNKTKSEIYQEGYGQGRVELLNFIATQLQTTGYLPIRINTENGPEVINLIPAPKQR